MIIQTFTGGTRNPLDLIGTLIDTVILGGQNILPRLTLIGGILAVSVAVILLLLILAGIAVIGLYLYGKLTGK